MMDDQTDGVAAQGTSQITYAAQSVAAVAVAVSTYVYLLLFDENRRVVILIAATATLASGCLLAIFPRTRSWGGVVVAAALAIYSVAALS